MSDAAIFFVGIAVFTISVYGVVMAGGLLLTRDSLKENPQYRRRVDEAQRDATLPTDARF
jgi:hypothetical protein